MQGATTGPITSDPLPSDLLKWRVYLFFSNSPFVLNDVAPPSTLVTPSSAEVDVTGQRQPGADFIPFSGGTAAQYNTQDMPDMNAETILHRIKVDPTPYGGITGASYYLLYIVGE